MGNEQTGTNSNLTISKQEVVEQLAWANVAGFSDIKYFWKDMKRRFEGVSQSFLDYYGFESDEMLIGKTDEDMGWNVSDNRFRYDEEDVLETGKRIVNVAGKCLIKGVLHETYTNKRPIYRDGEIIGLFGFFVDAESINGGGRSNSLITVDKETGLCNARGIVDSYYYFQEENDDARKSIFSIGLQADGYEEHRQKYGDKAAGEYLKAVVDVLLMHYQTKAVIAHLQANKFMLLVRYDNAETLQHGLELLRNDLEKITEIGGNPCSCDPYIVTNEVSTLTKLEESLGMFWATSDRQNVHVLNQIISILGAEYDGLVYLNLDTQEAIRFKQSGIFGDAVISNYENFKEAYDAYVKGNVSAEEGAAFIELGKLENIRENLSGTKIFEKKYLNNEGHHCVVRSVKLEEPQQKARHIIFAFTDRDKA